VCCELGFRHWLLARWTSHRAVRKSLQSAAVRRASAALPSGLHGPPRGPSGVQVLAHGDRVPAVGSLPGAEPPGRRRAAIHLFAFFRPMPSDYHVLFSLLKCAVCCAVHFYSTSAQSVGFFGHAGAGPLVLTSTRTP